MEKQSSIDWKKLAFCFLFAIIFGIVLVIYLEVSEPELQRSLMWSSEIDYCFAVEAPFDGDTFKAGTYRFYGDNFINKGKEKAWRIYVSPQILNNRRDLVEEESLGFVGGAERNEIIVKLDPGSYVYVRYCGTKGFSEGSLRAKLTKNK